MSDDVPHNGSGSGSDFARFPSNHLMRFPLPPLPSGLRASVAQKPEESQSESWRAQDEQLRLPLLDLSVLSKPEPLPRAWTLQDYVPANETTLLTGAGGVGKSLFGQQLATCIAATLPFLGVPTSGSAALYVSCEDDFDELTRRQLKICAAIGGCDLTGRLHLSSLRGLLGNELCEFDAGRKLIPSSRFGALARTIRDTGSGLVVLDNVGHFFIGNENDRGEVTQFVNLLNMLAQDEHCTIILLGHPNKSGDSYSGSTAWLNAVRSQLELSWADSKGSVPSVSEMRRLTLGKANYARVGATLDFRWHQSAFVLDSDLTDVERRSLASSAKEAGDDEVFLDCLRLRIAQRRAVSENRSPSFAPSEFAKMPDSKCIGKDRLEKAMNRLFASGKIERGYLWKNDGRKQVYGLRETGISCA